GRHRCRARRRAGPRMRQLWTVGMGSAYTESTSWRVRCQSRGVRRPCRMRDDSCATSLDRKYRRADIPQGWEVGLLRRGAGFGIDTASSPSRESAALFEAGEKVEEANGLPRAGALGVGEWREEAGGGELVDADIDLWF